MGEVISLETVREVVFDRNNQSKTAQLCPILNSIHPILVEQLQVNKLTLPEKAALADILHTTTLPQTKVEETVIRTALEKYTHHWYECLHRERYWACLYVLPALNRWIHPDNEASVITVCRLVGDILRILRLHKQQTQSKNT